MSQIDVLEIKVVETCNYSCVGCGSFSNLAKKEEYGLDELRSDLVQISSIVDKIRELRLYGGEPLLNPELIKYVRVSRECLPNSDIVIITNGTLLHTKDDSFFKALKRYDAKIFVSYYPLNHDIIDKGVEKANNNSVPVKKAHIKYFYVKMRDQVNEGDITKRFNECHAMCKGAVYLDHGYLYSCPYAPNFRHYDAAFGVKYENKEDGYNIYCEGANSVDLGHKMRQPLSACSMCDDELAYVTWKQAPARKENWLCSKDNPYIIEGYKWYDYLEEEKAIDFLAIKVDRQNGSLLPKVFNTVDLPKLKTNEIYLWLFDEYSICYITDLFSKEFDKFGIQIAGLINGELDQCGLLNQYKKINVEDISDNCYIISLYHYYGQRVKVMKDISKQMKLKIK